MTKIGDHAVVLGASMGGLLTARVLADFYRTVTVVERDVLPDTPSNRKGVPQGRHGHVLLRRGSQILSELFPGLLDQLVADGVPVWNDGDLSKLDVSFHGHQIVRSGRFVDLSSTTFYSPSRPLLEFHVRQRVLGIANVTMLERRDVLGLACSPGRDRITGVQIANRENGTAELLDADLVVDAMGRGSRMPAFLERLGYERPSEDELVIRLTYSTQPFHLPPGTLKERVYVYNFVPGRPKAVSLLGCENDNWLLTVQGMMGQETPSDRTEMLDFVADVAPAHVLEVLKAAEPTGEVARHRTQSNRWRRYDKLRRLPTGLLVVGDAICSFNPTYGQGMTVAAIEALVLCDCLRDGGPDLSHRFFASTAKAIGVAWQMAVGSDLALPEVQATRPISVRLPNAYNDWVLSAAESDLHVAEQFWKVLNLVERPSRLLRPSVIARVIITSLRRLATRSLTRQENPARRGSEPDAITSSGLDQLRRGRG
jgi:2-polyprenyl-6-methoxyphenol hydroxylase-like FAD-dependent oxidoreductase